MRYVSLFSGVEAASVAWGPLGWEPVAFCEVDPFPSAVLAARFPNVPNLGDVTKVDWKEFHGRYGAVDVLVGGSPCQSFSIAGNREGLAGESGLMFEYIRAVRELVRASRGGSPRYVLWENVPGALSSERGAAFGQLLAELDELGYGLAWRVLDAQYARVPGGPRLGFLGPVPQRRRRVFLVGSLGTPHAAEILFERSCLFGDHPKGREAREALAEDATGSPGVGDCAGFRYNQRPSSGGDGGIHNAVAFEQNQRGEVRLNGGDGSVAGALSSNPAQTKGQGALPVALPMKMDTTPKFGDEGDPAFTLRARENGGGINDMVCMTQYGDVAGTLRARADSSPCVDSGQNVVCMSSGQSNAEVREDGGAPSLTCLHESPIVAHPTEKMCSPRSWRPTEASSSSTTRALTADGSSSNRGTFDVVAMADDNGKAAVDVNLCGTLKNGGGTPSIAMESTSPGRCAPATGRESAPST